MTISFSYVYLNGLLLGRAPSVPCSKKKLPSLIILTSIMLWLINITTTHYSIRIWIHCCNTYIKLLHQAVLVNISVINKIVLVTVVMAVHLCNLPMSPRSTNKKKQHFIIIWDLKRQLSFNSYTCYCIFNSKTLNPFFASQVTSWAFLLCKKIF